MKTELEINLAVALRSVRKLLGGAGKWSPEDVLANANCADSVAEDALAEYDASQSTPAGEVTADAVEVADDVSGLMWELLGKVNAYTDDRGYFVLSRAGVKACLSQVIGALIERAANTQEALSTMHTQYKEASAERETLSAANARLAKDAERYRVLRDHAEGLYILECDIFIRGSNFTAYRGGGTQLAQGDALDKAVDDGIAATAQAKQAEGTE